MKVTPNNCIPLTNKVNNSQTRLQTNSLDICNLAMSNMTEMPSHEYIILLLAAIILLLSARDILLI